MLLALFSFAQPAWLLLGLLLLPSAAWLLLYRRWHRLVLQQLGNSWLAQQLRVQYSAAKATRKQVLLFCVLLLLVLAAAQPRIRTTAAVQPGKGRDVVVALDVSRSMLSCDLSPNRLERARQLAERFIQGLNDDRVALVLFAGNAYLSMPLTTDAGAFRLFLQAANPEAVPLQGTAIGSALQRALEAFPPSSGRNRFVLLLTDGEDHDAAAAEWAQRLQDEGILLLVVGIGTPAGAPVTDAATGLPKSDANGQPIISRLNETLLRQLAAKGNGMYGTLADTEAMTNDLLQVVNRYEKKANAGTLAGVQYRALFPWLLLLALLLLVYELLLTNRKNRTQAIGLLWAIIPLTAAAQQTELQKGNRAYGKQQYAEAAAHYRNALQKGSLPQAAYNLGNALFEQQQLTEAIRWYEAGAEAATTPQMRAEALYNKGVALHQNKQLPEAIAAYKTALLLAPNDRMIRINLQIALQAQRKQQQQQQSPQPPPPKKRQNQSKQQQPASINPRQAEQYLQVLQQQERQLQQQMQKKQSGNGKPEKDW